VAAHAIGGVKRVIIVDMALRAGSCGVRAREREAGDAVIERCRIPADGGMAASAIGGGKCWPGGRVDRIVGLLPCGEVAPGIAAIIGSNLEVVIIVNVATGAGHVGVAIGQGEAGSAVIEDDVGP
jgi:hypothetical protein